jgi:hypothetical protein
MRKITLALLALLLTGYMSITSVYAQNKASMDPMSVDDMTIGLSVGPGTPVWGNGEGFGPAVKFTFEKGMWQLGPGVLTLGAEATFSFFGHRYGNDYREAWMNFVFGARSA